MSQVVLKPPRIHPLVRQGIAAGMAQHMNVDREGDATLLACPLDHLGDAFSLEGITPFVDENMGVVAL